MDITNAIALFDTLSQETRLRAFRLLVEAGHQGMPAGVLSDKLKTPQNTLSFHLSHLSSVGIIHSRREGRSIIYTANYDVMHELIHFMVKDCCSAEFASIHQDRRSGCSVIELANCCDVTAK